MKKLLLSIICLAFIAPAFAENVTLTTYYPAPSGAYKAMRSHGMCVGAACTHAMIADNILSVDGQIGVGTTAPGYAFQLGSGTANHVGPAGAFINGDLEVSGNFWGSGANLSNLAQGAVGEIQYNDGTNNLAGAANFVFDQNTGNVGIGSTNPQARLDVQGSGATSATSALTVQNSLNNINLTVLDNGTVGIGTTVPTSRLTVHNPTDQGSIGISGTGDGNMTYSALYLFDNTPGTANSWSFAHKKEVSTDFQDDLHIARFRNDNTGFIPFAIDSVTGNVGIGTIAPQARVDVIGQIRITGGSPAAGKVLTSSDANGLAIWQTNPANARTWQNVTAQRAMNTVYTNATGNPIEVNASAGTDGPTTLILQICQNSTCVDIHGSSYPAPMGSVAVAATVPAGATYRAYHTQFPGPTSYWSELR